MVYSAKRKMSSRVFHPQGWETREEMINHPKSTLKGKKKKKTPYFPMKLSLDYSNTPWYTLLEHAVVGAGTVYFIVKVFKNVNFVSLALKVASSIPAVDAKIKQEQQDSINKIEDLVFGHNEDSFINESLPEKGFSDGEIIAIMKSWREKETDYNAGKVFGGIYHKDQKKHELLNIVSTIYSDSNALYPTVFPGLRKFEAEVISMTVKMLSGDAKACGTMNSGGTESILMAMKAYRDRALELFGITKPEMIIPESAHAAFIKASHYFGIKLIRIPVNKDGDCRVNLGQLKSAINRNTIVIVGSAPSFPHGVIDDIEEIGKLIKNKPHIGLHVDSCLGGFVLPFLKKIGDLTRNFDFTVPEVTSISADIHKYGLGPKGSSVLLWRNEDYRKYQFFVYTDWCGGLYCSPSLQGSRAGSAIAASWATLMSYGEEGYTNVARRYNQTFQTLIKGINGISGLKVLGNPDACCIAWVASDPNLDIFKVGDAITNRGWSVNRLQLPKCLQIQVASREDFNPQEFISALQESAEDVKANPDNFKAGMAGVYGSAALAAATAPEILVPILQSYLGSLLKVKRG